MAGCVFPMGPESFKRFTPDSLAAIEQRIAQEKARRNKEYQEVGPLTPTHKPEATMGRGRYIPRLIKHTEVIKLRLLLGSLSSAYFWASFQSWNIVYTHTAAGVQNKQTVVGFHPADL